MNVETYEAILNDKMLKEFNERKTSLLTSILPNYQYNLDDGNIDGIYDEKTQEILDRINKAIEDRIFQLERSNLSQRNEEGIRE